MLASFNSEGNVVVVGGVGNAVVGWSTSGTFFALSPSNVEFEWVELIVLDMRIEQRSGVGVDMWEAM